MVHWIPWLVSTLIELSSRISCVLEISWHSIDLMAVNPRFDIPDLFGKVVLVTGGELSMASGPRLCILQHLRYLTHHQYPQVTRA